MQMKHYPAIDPEATGRQIVRLRKERGLTVRDMQNWFGFDAPQAIYKWQKGQTLPSVDNLYALSTLLGAPIKDILVPTGYTVFSRFGGHNQNRSERVKLARKRSEDKKHNHGADR